MLTRALDWTVRTYMKRVALPGQVGESAARNTREVIQSFSEGASCALRRPAEAAAVAETIRWNRREFFWEGVGFGQAVRHSFSFRRGTPDRYTDTKRYRLMYYTGYGFWKGVAAAHHLPSFSLDPRRWENVDDFRRYAPLVAGGISFGLILAKRRFDERVLAKVPSMDLEGWQVGTMHGCGRALWFLHMNDFATLEKVVRAHARHAEELLEGLGIAIAFTQLADAERIMPCIRSFPADLQAPVLRGAGVALAQAEDPELIRKHTAVARVGALKASIESCEAACALAQGEGARWYDVVLHAVRGQGERGNGARRAPSRATEEKRAE
jgi:hypothetical protein